MIWIPGGIFRMECDRQHPEEAPVNRFTVDGFWIDRTPVANRELPVAPSPSRHPRRAYGGLRCAMRGMERTEFAARALHKSPKRASVDARTTAARITCRLARLAIMAVVFLAGLDATAPAEEAAPRGVARLEQLVAPIALYPDALLAQMLMASTYPLEVSEAARWAQTNAGVGGESLEDAMQQQPWDASVKGLTALPQVLQMMNENIQWTQALGDALLAQQQGVLDTVQRLRARAAARGALQTMPQQRLVKVAAPPEPGSSAAAGTVYVIEATAADE
jgi:hypothetical protein